MWSLPADRKPRAHFCGIGGAGMVAAARLAVLGGWEVRGSDNPLYPPTSHMVEALGVPVAEGYAPHNLDWDPDVVIIGNALSRGNPEVEEVLERGLRYTSYPEWLRFTVLQERRPIVVAGTHGKTTTTALIAHTLQASGRDPGFFIGGQPVAFPHSAELGKPGGPFVIEGDEYDTAFFDKRAKFFHYLPRTAVVTSLEFDHADIYAHVEEIERAFQLMLRQIPASGELLVCADDPGARALQDVAFSRVATYGFAGDADWRAEMTARDETRQGFRLFSRGEPWGEFNLPLFGRHNVRNATAAVAVAAAEGLTPPEVAAALESFAGIRRRMEVFLKSDGIVFIDDFAHHPTAIRETIDAVQSRWPGERITVLFEPRSNTTATNRFQRELGEVFDAATEIWIGPIYRADRYPPDTLLDRERLTADIQARGPRAHYTDDVEAIVRHIRSDVEPHDIVLILSNGAFGGIYDLIRAYFTGQDAG